ncbi:GNAT family N-acetyltransferase [Aeromicrobium sp. 636]|uniref:GNAT family N-acetyltransferase n=1 Tax=Aeromicrobium senzhongii TaxID=2663859 RepID=A0A8I0ETR9_9ACTN|nr:MULTISPECIES: GNAT family N-acetyltransferase [Aeromicrobium]MBC9225944.1 GNAT family N-acetyltransferase [Aeromicrobium senzhongii]MCQ3998051.1 GNAT family N-acetyltransferase [Aeromicrobium sp. 636]
MGTWIVRAATASDRNSWERLYRGYCTFYQRDVSVEHLDTLWSWIQGQDIHARVVEDPDNSGELVGLAHLREFLRPIVAGKAGFLDDLFIDPDLRGSGASRANFEDIRVFAEDRGWERVRWITAEDNYRARGLHDQLGERTAWVTYDMEMRP